MGAENSPDKPVNDHGYDGTPRELKRPDLRMPHGHDSDRSDSLIDEAGLTPTGDPKDQDPRDDHMLYQQSTYEGDIADTLDDRKPTPGWFDGQNS